MRVVGAMIFYQDAPMLKRSLPALRERVDHLIVVDGAYRDFPDYGNPASTDESLTVAEDYADEIVPCWRDASNGETVAWETEIDKRNEYLRRGQEGDWFIVVDADEVVEGSVDKAVLETRTDWDLRLYREEDFEREHARRKLHNQDSPEEDAKLKASMLLHRCFKWREGIEYKGTHHAVHVGGKLIHPSELEREEGVAFPGLFLRHVQKHRDMDRVIRKGRYYAVLASQERDFRARYSL